MIATGAHVRGRTKRFQAIRASDAKNSDAPAAARVLPVASAHVTMALITAMYATTGPASPALGPRRTARTMRVPTTAATTMTAAPDTITATTEVSPTRRPTTYAT